MDDLIEALTILRKYGNPEWPTYCEHDCLFVIIDPKIVSDEDNRRLESLGFHESGGPDHVGCYQSFRFGSA